MPSISPQQLSVLAAVVTFFLVLLAEKLHFRRIDAAARLAVGPSGEVRRWVKSTPLVRASCLAAITWALLTLYCHGGAIYQGRAKAEDLEGHHRVVFLADLSPSMHLPDAGPSGDQLRIARMHEVVDAVLARLDGQVVFTVICFYTDVMPAVVDAEDSELVRNIFAGLPVWYVMESGKTDLGAGVRESMALLREYPANSATVLVCTDGDTLPIGLVPACPDSVREVFVLGVGDSKHGTFIDDHISRQDPAVLRSLAGRLGGKYIDVNEKHVPTYSLGSLVGGGGPKKRRFGLIDVAIYVLVGAATMLALLPVALGVLGTDWRAVRPTTRMRAT